MLRYDFMKMKPMLKRVGEHYLNLSRSMLLAHII